MKVSILLLFLLFHLDSVSQIRLTGNRDIISLDTSFSVLDVNEELSVQRALEQSDGFVPNTMINPNFGIKNHSIWIKFAIENESKLSEFLLNVAYPLLGEVELYAIDSLKNITLCSAMGRDRAFGTRAYEHPNYLFNIRLSQNESKLYLMRVKSAGQIILPITVGKASTQWELLSKENILLGFYLGAVFIMSVYNFFLFLSVRDKSYLYYVLYVTFLGLTQLGIRGFNFQFLWPNHPYWESMSIVVFASISSMGVLLFTDHFLHLKQNAPRLRSILLVLFFSFACSIAFVTFGAEQLGFQVMQFATSVETVVLFVISLVVLLKGYAPAKYFFISWSVLLFGAIIFLLKDYRILPYNFYTSNSFQIASVIEMALLSFALAARINLLKKDKELSQAQALLVSKENETLIREQNIILEQRVGERTYALKESNESLQQTLTHLKEAQTQLVESEKMASLGQLTAGVAHEINNPINFVTSNVAPLKRDVNMIWDAMEEVERIALADDIPFEERERRIRAYKDEIDIEYLKTEIDFLLKGMHEGATRTAEIVKSLRIFSRVDEESLKFADINEGLDSTLVILSSVIREGVTVVKEFGELPLIECYPGKLNQVFLNIITNGIYAINKKFEGKQGGVLEIKTTADAENAYISIRDNGVGMPDEVKEKMFEPFFTTKEVGEGTGLGMSIVYNTIKRHGGEIKVESILDEGVSFLIIIPLTQQVQ